MDERFRSALATIDAGDCAALGKLLASDPDLVHRRADSEDRPYDGYFRRATLLHHCAGNPAREPPVPDNIVDVARTLLEAGAEVDASTEFGDDWNWTTLGLVASSTPAAERGFAEPMFDLLIEHGADIDWGNGINLYGAFSHTVECEKLRDVAASLHRRGAGLDLAYAAAVGDLDAMARFCGDGDTLAPGAYSRYRPVNNRIEQPTRKDVLDEALVFAAMNSRIKALDRLLECGATLDGTAAIHAERPTAMHAAAWAGSLPTVRHLLAHGADPTIRDEVHNSSVIGWADFRKRDALRDYLLGDDARIDLRDAIEFGRFGRAMELIEQVEVDAPVKDGDPGVLLRAAAYHGHVELVRYMLQRGADPKLENREGRTALDYAREQQHTEIVSLLRKTGPPD